MCQAQDTRIKEVRRAYPRGSSAAPVAPATAEYIQETDNPASIGHWPQISYINQTRRDAGRDVTAPTCPRTTLMKAVLPCLLCQLTTKQWRAQNRNAIKRNYISTCFVINSYRLRRLTWQPKVILATTVYCLTYADSKREARSCIQISIWCGADVWRKKTEMIYLSH
jgi:hypothetical protein